MLKELKVLNAFRLEHDLTFQDIADQMSAIGYPISPPTLQRMLRHPHRTPLERNLYKVRKFIAHLKAKAAARDGASRRGDGAHA
jgi:hypothetical protein